MEGISYSELRTALRCPKKHHYAYVEKIVPKKHSLALSKGSLIHECLANHLRGEDWTDPVKKYDIDMENVFDEERQEWLKLKQDVYAIMKGYLDAYRETDKTKQTIHVEKAFSEDVSEIKLHGYIDWVYKEGDEIWVVDHKTTNTIPTIGDEYTDLQGIVYMMALMTNWKRTDNPAYKNIRGVVYNYIRSKPPAKPDILKNGSISKRKIDTNYATYLAALKANGEDLDAYEEQLKHYQQNASKWYKRVYVPFNRKAVVNTFSNLFKIANNLDKDYRVRLKHRCEWDCPYYELCTQEYVGNTTDLLRKNEFKQKEERDDREEKE